MDKILTSVLPGTFFRNIPDTVRYAAESRFIKPPIHPAEMPTILAGNGFASLGTVNVTNYDDYVWADPRTLEAFRASVTQSEVGSVETTHGVIRILAEEALGAKPKLLFVITDSIGYFDMEVAPRSYAQNFAAAHNAGALLAWLLPEIGRQLLAT